MLAPVRGRPFLSYLLDQLEAAGVQEVALCVGYLGAQIERSFGTSYRGLRLAYSWEASPLGTGGALRNAASLLHSDTVLVANGDSYCDADLQALLDRHRQWCAAATLLLCRCRVPDGTGALSLTGMAVSSPLRRRAVNRRG